MSGTLRAIEFFAVAAMFAAFFGWGMITGTSVMKWGLSAKRTGDPARFWAAQGVHGAFALFFAIAAAAVLFGLSPP
ncbi:MAG TPA: hypothetical protein VL358_04875 [Caulobacteraceae bacterium]|jgi:hypothetical protein|nr:hypothetical protein [Caulobacteraceae bacterium]